MNVNLTAVKHRLLCPLLLVGALLAPQTQAAQTIDAIAAIVDNDVVLVSDLQQRVRIVQDRFRGQPLPPMEQLQRQVLEQLAVERLQVNLAKERGIRVSDSELNQTLMRTAESNGMTLAQFRDALQAEGNSFEHFRDEIRNTLLIQRLQAQAVNSRIRISDQEVKQLLSSPNSILGTLRYRLSHILLPLPDAPSPEQIQQVQQAAETLYQQLQQGADFAQLAVAHSRGQTALEGGDLGWRAPAEIPSIFADVVPDMTIGEVSQPIRTPSGFHLLKLVAREGAQQSIIQQTHARHILIKPTAIRSDEQARLLAEQIHSRIQKGEDFGNLAREYTDDTGSKLAGGDLNWVNPGQTVEVFEQTMNNLAVGAMSQPVRSEFGWHIIQVLERRDTDMSQTLLEAEARNILRKRRYDEELQNWLREIQANAYIDYKI